MATFRTNHGVGRGRGSGNNFFRSILLIFIAVGVLAVLALLIKKDYFQTLGSIEDPIDYEIPLDTGDPDSRYYLPSGSEGEMVHHKYFSLSYVEKYELAEWVAYELTRESLVVPNVGRTDWYTEDSMVKTGSANYHDYKGSGYSRGHLAPAGDMAFNQEAMEASFHMSNITPQKRRFNTGIWKELEENIRDWAFKNDRLFIVTGPVLDKSNYQRIGQNEVAVPDRYYKVVLDANDPEIKAVGFIIPNRVSKQPLSDFMVTVDDVEQVTGLDFYADLLSSDLQGKVESGFDPEAWPLSKKKYRLRVNRWNK